MLKEDELVVREGRVALHPADLIRSPELCGVGSVDVKKGVESRPNRGVK